MTNVLNCGESLETSHKKVQDLQDLQDLQAVQDPKANTDKE